MAEYEGDVWVQSSEHIVSLVTQEMTPDWHAFALKVQWQGDDRWAVVRHHQALDAEGNWDWQTADNRSDDEWLARFRFSEQEAKDLAVKYAPKVTVNGWQAQRVHDRFMAELEEAKAG